MVAAFAVLGFLLAVQLKSVKLNTALDATSASRLETLQELYNDLTTERDGLKSRLEEAQKELEQYRTRRSPERAAPPSRRRWSTCPWWRG